MREEKRARLFVILEGGPAADWVDKAFDTGMLLLIVLNVAAVTLETVESLERQYAPWFYNVPRKLDRRLSYIRSAREGNGERADGTAETA